VCRFLAQFDFPTALTFTVSRSKVVHIGDNLDITFQLSGTFHTTMDLLHFPVSLLAVQT
jgi:hypothetical protein